LIGNVWTSAVYPILGIAASWVYLIASAHDVAHPALGASGAIMGLAGMYLVLFPVHKVHMAFWWRWGLYGRFQLTLKLFPVRGFWVVLFYISFDVLYTSLGIHDGVAHWAHLGGFISGIVVALILLITRRVNGRGADALSILLGR